MRVPLNAGIALNDQQLVLFLSRALELPQDTEFTLLRLQGDELIVFFTSSPSQLARRGILRMTPEEPEILEFEKDPCYCNHIQAEALKLLQDRRELVVTRFSPLGGTCVGSEVVSILSVGEDGSLSEVWRGTSFDAEGSVSRVATIEFADGDGDGNLEILRRGKEVDCGDDCLCRDGPVLNTFRTRHVWSQETGRFEPVP